MHNPDDEGRKIALVVVLWGACCIVALVWIFAYAG